MSIYKEATANSYFNTDSVLHSIMDKTRMSFLTTFSHSILLKSEAVQ